MAKLIKRRSFDFSRKEMAKLCGCSEKTFDNRLSKICERYSINPLLFKMDEEQPAGGENFYPVECAELLGVLLRSWEKNPTKRDNFNRADLTAKEIESFYRSLMEEIDKLHPSLRKLVRKLPSYFTTMEVIIWLTRLVDKLSFFADLYMKEGNDDTGALLKELTVRIDQSSYVLYSTKRLSDEATCCFTARKAGMGDKTVMDSNVGVDVGIARLIELLVLGLQNIKEEIQFNKLEDSVDIVASRNAIYQQLEYCIPSNCDETTIERYYNGATGWKGMNERIEEGEFDTKDLLIQYYEREINQRQADILALEQRIQAINGNGILPVDFEMMDRINKKYLNVYNLATDNKNEVRQYTDQYVGRVLWPLFAEK